MNNLVVKTYYSGKKKLIFINKWKTIDFLMVFKEY